MTRRFGYGRDLRLTLRLWLAAALLVDVYAPLALWAAGVLAVVSSRGR